MVTICIVIQKIGPHTAGPIPIGGKLSTWAGGVPFIFSGNSRDILLYSNILAGLIIRKKLEHLSNGVRKLW